METLGGWGDQGYQEPQLYIIRYTIELELQLLYFRHLHKLSHILHLQVGMLILNL